MIPFVSNVQNRQIIETESRSAVPGSGVGGVERRGMGNHSMDVGSPLGMMKMFWN